jgi:hypothetical protein
MTRKSKDTQHWSDRSFPYVLVYSTIGTIISLGSVWISTALSFAPTNLGA